ncbi:MAG TPA: hypothetical protein VJY62_12845 [Bacteroidia bacterium]|nr:hypothetical protein [Bacteroidia bacterium]
MTYLLRIKNESKAKSLLQFLKSIDFVEVSEHNDHSEWKEIVRQAERTKSIPLSKALAASEKWKSK